MLRFPWTGEVCEGLLEYGFPVMVVVEQAEEFAWLSQVGDVQYTVSATEISHVIVSAHYGPEWDLSASLSGQFILCTPLYEEPPMLEFRVPSAKYGQFRGSNSFPILLSYAGWSRCIVLIHA